MPLVMVELRGEGGDPRPFTAVEGGASIVARQVDMVFTFRSTALKAAFALTVIDMESTDRFCKG
jgi:hypothetical protein